ncbi:putative plasma membrane protein [Dissostichus eleginoides]|uniref:Plasma membrane protein n=1 Tax=Dissostichus eleginoides TaxID=100907 RepID=A0AAD9CA91_DISEL|nr:putative plasma membrane protein [Dissostichus eleginoides]
MWLKRTTLLLLTATVSPTESLPLLDLWMWISLGVSTFILIVLLVVCLLLRRRHRRSRAEDPIYANTRPVANKHPSPRPGVPVDTLKKASSSQNLRNPSPARRCQEDKRRCKL